MGCSTALPSCYPALVGAFLIFCTAFARPLPAQEPTAEDARWPAIVFKGTPWDAEKEANPDVATALTILARDPLGHPYSAVKEQREESLASLRGARLLEAYRKDLEALATARPASAQPWFLLAELHEFQPDDPFQSEPEVLAFPGWLRLERKGARVTASSSRDGQSWQERASKEIAVGEECLAGIFVKSANRSMYCTAEFDSLDLKSGGSDEAWQTATVGEVPGPARSTQEDGRWKVSGINRAYETEGAFLFRKTEKEAVLTVRVLAMENTNAWAEAGIMVRGGLEKEAASMRIAMRPAGDVAVSAEGLAPAALAPLERLAKLLPDEVSVQTRFANALYLARRYKAAEEIFLRSIAKDAGTVFALYPDTILSLFEKQNRLSQLANALLQWKPQVNSKSAVPGYWTFAGPASRLREAGDYELAIRVLEHGMDHVWTEYSVPLLAYYLQLLDETGRLKEGKARLIKQLAAAPVAEKGSPHTYGSLLAAFVDPKTHEERPLLLTILEYAKQMGALDDVAATLAPAEAKPGRRNLLIALLAAAYAAKESKLDAFSAFTEELRGGLEMSVFDLQLSSHLGSIAYHTWPAAKKKALTLMAVSAQAFPDRNWEEKTAAWHRCADAALAERNFEAARVAAESAAGVRIRARDAGVGNRLEERLPPPDFKTAQLLKITGSKMDPMDLLDPYEDLANLRMPLQILTKARLGSVQTRLTGKPQNLDLIAYPVPNSKEPQTTQLAVELAPGPLRGAHDPALTAGQPIKIREFAGAFDLEIWYGRKPDSLRRLKEISAAPAYSELLIDEMKGLGYVRIDSRAHGSEEPFKAGAKVFPILIGRNLAPDPGLTEIRPGKIAKEAPEIEGWSKLPFGIFSQGDPGPIPNISTLRFVPRESTDRVTLEMRPVPVQAGKRYMQSIWLRCPPRPGTITAGIRFLGANGEALGMSECPEDWDDPRWLFTAQVLTTRDPESDREVRIPDGTTFLRPYLRIWMEADWCDHFLGETE